jgi:hypothetical protein
LGKLSGIAHECVRHAFNRRFATPAPSHSTDFGARAALIKTFSVKANRKEPAGTTRIYRVRVLRIERQQTDATRTVGDRCPAFSTIRTLGDAGISTGNAFADLLVGQINSYQQVNSQPKYYFRYQIAERVN